jgi:dihydrofolate reductase
MQVGLILALTRQGVIGRDNSLPWKLSVDLKRFRALTTHQCIIMGRKTFESIGRALPERLNIVVSSQPSWSASGVRAATSFDQALEIATAHKHAKVFVIGGAQLANSVIDRIDFAHLTWVENPIPGDTHFGKLDWSDFESTSRVEGEENGIRYCFEDFVRR